MTQIWSRTSPNRL